LICKEIIHKNKQVRGKQPDKDNEYPPDVEYLKYNKPDPNKENKSHGGEIEHGSQPTKNPDIEYFS
jgi:hypothetical protein